MITPEELRRFEEKAGIKPIMPPARSAETAPPPAPSKATFPPPGSELVEGHCGYCAVIMPPVSSGKGQRWEVRFYVGPGGKDINRTVLEVGGMVDQQSYYSHWDAYSAASEFLHGNRKYIKPPMKLRGVTATKKIPHPGEDF
jgi:hypothetical protein